MRKNFILLGALMLILKVSGQAQTTEAIQTARQYLGNHQQAWQLETDDIAQMRVSDAYTSAHNGVTHVYMVQQHNGIDVDDATYNVNIQDGEVLIAFEHMVRDVASRVSGDVQISPTQAIAKVVNHYGEEVRGPIQVKEQKGEHAAVFYGGAHSHIDMPVRKIYTPGRNGEYSLAYEVIIEPSNGHEMYSVKVNAENGKIMNEVSLSAHCAFPDNFLAGYTCSDETDEMVMSPLPNSGDGAKYNVVPIPFESPNHGDRQVVVDPADAEASPYGWHDFDGVAGHESTTTHGNNVHAFADRDGDLQDNELVVDGGDTLVFNFPFDQSLEPEDYQEAAVTNLFYMNNVMHDFTYHYGFDEISGNFQSTNYTSLGAGGDEVNAHSQFGASTATPPTNNAVFGTPPDGGSGRMRMYIWTGAGANQLLSVDHPSDVAGTYNTSTTTDWGQTITNEPVTGEVYFVDDGTAQPTQGCNSLVNASQLEGKIAMIDRGSCEFGRKALNAEEAGAIGFIICNFEEGLVNMGAGAVGGQVTIPGVFIANSDCQRIRAFAGDGLVVTLVNLADTSGPQNRSGSFDNGVIAHEYGHGISNRLTFGPGNVGCLNNYDHDFDGTPEDGEQMGEGWSDFFTLVTSVKPGDTPEKIRGIGTYAQDQDTNGLGIRPFPYTVDMSINPMTYDDIAFYSVPHGIGSVWCTMLWDLYWALTERYGFDPDLYTGTGGNNLAIQLVMDGMKMQPCHPSFTDGRDAILAADRALTGGANQKLIWEVFARRGLGFSATAGEEQFRLDGSEAFDVRPDAISSVKLYKEMTPTIEAGDVIDVTLTVHNHKSEAATSAMLSDVIPDEASFVPGSASHSVQEQGDMLMFDLGTVAAGDSMTVTYQLQTSTGRPSEQFFVDDMEEGSVNWAVLSDEGTEIWQLQDFNVNSGTNAWGVASLEENTDVSLVNIDPIEVSGDQPVLSFFHSFDTERFYDAGILQISSDGGFSWQTVPEDQMVRQGYSGKIPFSLFAFQRIRGWFGQSQTFVRTFVDLSDYVGEEVQFRWRYGSDDNTAQIGWFIDDVEVMDAFTYNSEACFTSTEGDDACSEAPQWGTIVESGVVSSSRDIVKDNSAIRVYPNPAQRQVTVEIDNSEFDEYTIELISYTGEVVRNQRATGTGTTRVRMNVQDVVPGMYFVKVTSDDRQSVVKLVVD